MTILRELLKEKISSLGLGDGGEGPSDQELYDCADDVLELIRDRLTHDDIVNHVYNRARVAGGDTPLPQSSMNPVARTRVAADLKYAGRFL